ncbi:MAG: ABC transporter permease [Firmicutes bacterium]|jgi:NitT/TauT family transport system permease protein|nr:ABC transporter permease [Bacillota bacterium]
MQVSTGTNRGGKAKALSIGFLSVLGALAVWKIAAVWVGNELFLPGPESTLRVFTQLAAARPFWTHLAATMIRGLAGFGISYAVGVAAGLATGLNSWFDTAFRPFLVTIRSTPFMAVTVLALIWFRSDTVPVFVTFLMVFPLVTQNVRDGIRDIDVRLVQMARVYRVRQGRILRELYLPAILPYLAAGATAGLGLTWKATISAEVISNPRWGIGTQMDRARVFLNTSEVFAWTAVVIALGLAFDRLIDGAVQKRVFRWK